MNKICRSLLPPVELNEPNVCSAEVAALTSKNTTRILNTIKPVTRAFTTMDATKPVRTSGLPQAAIIGISCSISIAPSDTNQVTRGNKLKSADKTKIYSLTYVYDCQKWRNNHNADIFTPHDPTTVDLWRYRWIKWIIGTMIYAYQCTLSDEVTTSICCDLDKRNAKWSWL